MNTDQNLIDYAAARGVTITEEQAPILLTKSMDWLDAQALDYPDDPVPDDILKAQLVAAMLINDGNDLLAPLGGQILTGQRVEGAVSRTFSDKGSNTRVWPQLERLIAPYRADGGLGAANFKVSR